MKRRTLIGGLTGGGLVVGLGGWFSYRIRNAPHPHWVRLDQVRQWLDESTPPALRSSGPWSPAQIFNHCAQSLEYSLHGFPAPKPAWFRATIGPAVYGVFRHLGAMKHDLAEPVPGSSVEDLDSDLDTALARLREAIDAFTDPQRPLQPHFAYGALSREEFAAAHAMHISEHVGQLHPA